MIKVVTMMQVIKTEIIKKNIKNHSFSPLINWIKPVVSLPFLWKILLSHLNAVQDLITPSTLLLQTKKGKKEEINL